MSWVELALEQALMPAMVPMGGQPTPTFDLKRGEVRVPKRVAYYGSSASIPAPEATPESSSPAPPDPDTASTMECPNAPDHPLGWSERRGYVCAVCVNTKAVPR